MAAHFSYTLTVQLEYTTRLFQFLNYFSIMLALCLMLSLTYYAQNYAQNYAGIISWSLLEDAYE